MYKIIYYTILCFSFFNFVVAQNLIPNPSFEEAFPDTTTDINYTNNFTCKEWSSPTKGTPDYFTATRTGLFSTPKNCKTTLATHSGKAYVAFYIKLYKQFYEYLQVKLKAPLIKDSIYCISMFASISQLAAFSTNEVDCFFTKSQNNLNLDYKIIVDVPYVKLSTNDSCLKPGVWNQIVNYYKAKGGEEFIVIGMLNKDYNNVRVRDVWGKDIQKGIYMFIDDVSLKPITDSTYCKLDEINDYTKAINKPLILKNLNFESNKTVLKNTSYAELTKLATYLKQNPNYKIEITGYTDDIGTEASNLNLSKGRAKTVADFLIKERVSVKKITYKGLGSKAPLKPNDNDENRAQNRRVEILILK